MKITTCHHLKSRQSLDAASLLLTLHQTQKLRDSEEDFDFKNMREEALTIKKIKRETVCAKTKIKLEFKKEKL